jgi:hypothetical protein
VWLKRVVDRFPHLIWLNPVRRGRWEYSASTRIIQEIIGPDRMHEMTLQGLDGAMKALGR